MSDSKQAIDVKEAIRIAKQQVADLFSADEARNIGLEEVAFDAEADEWHITVGFSRPWDSAPTVPQLSYLFPDSPARTYKVVALAGKTGKVLRVTNRSV